MTSTSTSASPSTKPLVSTGTGVAQEDELPLLPPGGASDFFPLLAFGPSA